MDAKTNIKARLPSRHVTEGPARAPHCLLASREATAGTAAFDAAVVFKKTPYIADLRPGGRYVAKDIFEVGGIPLLSKTLRGHGFLQDDCMTVTDSISAENSVNQLAHHADA